ncbi:hypothetical protein OHA27_37925 [Streptomyces sp. NBC_01619]|uniref:hypothetical protein n=1 Tax=Streptomyces sp. NBC_01619 TaxID=2975901 RepID=UPI0022544BA7|nr:hypothetical protein [Streptomyces sp. NBC_01619]MCX4515900.1 hypothetical protein [Streptomyces sp. NBC_01619]
MSSTITLPQITAHIAANASEADMSRIIEVIKERRKTLATMAAAAVTVGATVEVVNIRPAAYKGMRGTVERITGNTATIKFDADSTEQLRWARNKQISVPDAVTEWTTSGFPLTCLRVV